MRLTRLRPQPTTSLDLETDAGAQLLRDHYRPGSGVHVRLNMIASLTGAAGGADGTSDTLTSPVDRRILGIIRETTDAIVVGAQSVRTEGYRVPRRGVLAVITASGDLSGAQIPAADADRVLVVHPEGADARVDASLRGLGCERVALPGTDRVDPNDVVRVLRTRGLVRLVCEGGPRLAAQFADADLIDEYCVTIAPALTAAGSFLPISHAPATALAGHLVDGAGFSYLRLQRSR